MTAVDRLFRSPVRLLAQDVREGMISARGVLDHYLARIERFNPKLNAMIFLDPDAQVAAEDSDRRLKAGRPRSALEGIPVAVKDNLLVRRQPAVWGSMLYAEYVADHDELPIARLRESGAVILGKTNVPEFTLRGFTDNPVFGVTKNPWDLTLTPGGSSGGSAAAVAAGLVPLALGTDGGGSIRRPAAHTGRVGVKPSIGCIPRGNGFPAILVDCEVVGPLVRTVDDVRIALGCLAGPHRADQRSRGLPVLPPRRETGSQRILFVERFGTAPVDHRIVASCRKAAEHFLDLASPEYQDQARAGAKMTSSDHLEIIEILNALRAQAGQAFASIDVIATPATAAQPWPASAPFPSTIEGYEVGPRGHAVFTGWVNACGHPALALPVDPAPDAIPIGLQIVGDFGAEGLLLDPAEDYGAGHPCAHRWPAFALG